MWFFVLQFFGFFWFFFFFLFFFFLSFSFCLLNVTGNYFFKVNDKNTRKRCEIYSQLTVKALKRRQRRRSNVFIVNFEYISHLFLQHLLVQSQQWKHQDTVLNMFKVYNKCIKTTRSSVFRLFVNL